ncbi:MAG: PUA domain-containing protein [Promethearchaeota archaeon]
MIQLPLPVQKLAHKHFISEAIVARLYNTISDIDRLDEILQAITTPPKHYYLRMNLTKASNHQILERFHKTYPDFISKFGPLENSLKVELKGPINYQEMPLLRKKVYCDKFAAESVVLGADLFVPGVCGTDGKFPEENPVSIMLSPDRFPKEFSVEKSEFEDKIQPKKLNPNSELESRFHVANGITNYASKDYPKLRNGIFVHNTVPKYSLPKYRSGPLYKEGWISEQNIPPNAAIGGFISTIIRETNYFKKSVTIIDTCSAPGHKTTAMAEWIQYYAKKQGITVNPKILSIDRSTNRLENLRKDKIRLNLQNIEVLPCKLERLLKKRPELENYADFLMFDPPCSALGTRPKLFLEKSWADLEDYPRNQRRLFKIVDRLVKPGGWLMYNTCTIPKEENEDQVAYAVEKLGYSIQNIPSPFKELGQPGIDHESLDKSETEKLLRFYPTIQEGIGYFIALLRKEKFVPDEPIS